MSSVWNAIGSFWATYGTWIGIALIPTIITGLSMSPALSAEIPFVQKIWEIIKTIMGVFSVATPKDTMGTFQLPLKVSKLKTLSNINKPAADSLTKTVAMLVILVLGVHLSSGCSWFKKEATTVGNIIVDCSAQSAEQVATADEIAEIIQAAALAKDLSSIIDAFVKQFGQNVIACAASKADQLLASKMTLAAGSGQVNETDQERRVRIKTQIDDRKWQVKGVQ